MEEEFERALDGRLVASMVAAGSLSFAAVVFETSLNVALPVLMEEFSVDTATIQWITSGYLLTLSCVMPLFPWLKSCFPIRKLFCCSVFFFMVGLLMSGFAPAFELLLMGRLLQGVGTGIALPLMFSIVTDQVPHEHQGMMMGVATLITGLAPAVGPTYGGFIMSIAGWHYVFFCLAPLVVLSLVAGLVCLRQATALRPVPFDAVGFLEVVLGFFTLVFGTNKASEFGWLSMPVALCFAISITLLTLFYKHACASKHPLIDVSVFHVGVFRVEVACVLLISFEILALAYLVPNYAQLALDAPSLLAGTLLLPGCLLAVCVSPIAGRLLDRSGAAIPVLIGVGSILVSQLAFLACAEVLSPYLMMSIYIIFGLGQGFAFGTSMTNGLSSLPQESTADGNSIFNTFQQLGSSLGVSVATAIVGAAQQSAVSLKAGTHAGGKATFMLLVFMGCVLVALTLIALHHGRKIQTLAKSYK